MDLKQLLKEFKLLSPAMQVMLVTIALVLVLLLVTIPTLGTNLIAFLIALKALTKSYEMSRYTVIRIRERFVNQGLDDALNHRPHTQTRARALNGEQKAHLIALSCSPCPVGQARWTLRLLAGRLVELGYTKHVSHETVRKVLKKTSSSRG